MAFFLEKSVSQLAPVLLENVVFSLFCDVKSAFPDATAFFVFSQAPDFHHVFSPLIFTSSLTPLLSLSFCCLISSSLSVFCCGRFFLCFVLSLVLLLRLLLRCCRWLLRCCCVAAAGCSFRCSLFVISACVFCQAIAEWLSGALFCAARCADVSWPSRLTDLISQTIRTSAMRVIHKPLRRGCTSRFAFFCALGLYCCVKNKACIMSHSRHYFTAPYSQRG